MAGAAVMPDGVDAPILIGFNDADQIEEYLHEYVAAVGDGGTMGDLARGFAALSMSAVDLQAAERTLETAPYEPAHTGVVAETDAAVTAIVERVRDGMTVMTQAIMRITEWVRARDALVGERTANGVCEGIGATLFVLEGVLRRRVLAHMLRTAACNGESVGNNGAGNVVTMDASGRLLHAAAENGLNHEAAGLSAALVMLAAAADRPPPDTTSVTEFVAALDRLAGATVTFVRIGGVSVRAHTHAAAGARAAASALATDLAAYKRRDGGET